MSEADWVEVVLASAGFVIGYVLGLLDAKRRLRRQLRRAARQQRVRRRK
jgi:hypothetical protein